MQRQEFLVAMTRLRACYPQRVADGDHWMAMIARYWEELRERDPAALTETMETAWKHFPSFFPGLGEIVDLYDQVRKQRASDRKALPETGRWGESGAARAREIIARVSGGLGADDQGMRGR